MKTFLKAMALVFFCLPLYGFEFYSKLKNEEGNRHYQKGRIGKAKSAYEKALKSSPESNEIAFNLGNTYYKEGSFAESLKKFKSAADKASGSELQAHAFYNIGNALYRQEDLKKAGEFYKQALRIDPADQDAKYNLELVEKKENQKQDQNQEPKKDQDKQPKPDQGEGQQKEEKPDQEKDQKAEPKEGEGQGEQKKDQEKDQAAEGEKEGEGGPDGQEPKKEKEPQDEESEKKPKSDAEARAEQILSALESGEQQAMKMQGSQNGPGPRVRRITEKDW